MPAVAPIRNPLPTTKIPFPPGPLINSVQQPVTEAVSMPDLSTPAERRTLLAADDGVACVLESLLS